MSATLHQYRILLVERDANEPRAFVVTEMERAPQEVDPHEWLEKTLGSYFKKLFLSNSRRYCRY